MDNSDSPRHILPHTVHFDEIHNINYALWVYLLWTNTLLAFRYYQAMISFSTTVKIVMVVTRLMYPFRTVYAQFAKYLESPAWFGQKDKHFTTISIIRCYIFIYGFSWITATFLLNCISVLEILINHITKLIPSTYTYYLWEFRFYLLYTSILHIHCFSC